MSEPITLYDFAGNVVIVHGPNMAQALIDAGALFRDPPPNMVQPDTQQPQPMSKRVGRPRKSVE